MEIYAAIGIQNSFEADHNETITHLRMADLQQNFLLLKQKFFLIHETTEPVLADCMGCICNVESNCQEIGCKWDVNSNSCGPYQIKYDYYTDCSSLLLLYHEVRKSVRSISSPVRRLLPTKTIKRVCTFCQLAGYLICRIKVEYYLRRLTLQKFSTRVLTFVSLDQDIVGRKGKRSMKHVHFQRVHAERHNSSLRLVLLAQSSLLTETITLYFSV